LEFLEAASLDPALGVIYTKANPAAGTVKVALAALERPGLLLDGESPIVKFSFTATGEGSGTVTLTGGTGGAYIDNESLFGTTEDIEMSIPAGTDASVSTDIAKYFDPYDFNRSGKVSIADLTYAQVFYGASAEVGDERWAHVIERGIDVDGSDTVDVADFIIIIDYIYGTGA
jgi:hypothetical protein